MVKRKYALAALALALTGVYSCLTVVAVNSSETVGGQERNILIYADAYAQDADSWRHEVVSQPSCGKVTPIVADGKPAFYFDRSGGVAKGTYRFSYVIHGSINSPPFERMAGASVAVTFTETVPTPDGSTPCGAQYQAFIMGAKDSGSGNSRVVSVSWSVPETSEFADTYRITVTEGQSGAALGSAEFGAPGNGGQVANIGHPQTKTLKIALDTILNGQVMFTDTMVIQGAPLDFMAVDDYIEVDVSAVGGDVLDPLENDYELSSPGGARMNWARLDGASWTMLNDGGLSANDLIIHRVVTDYGGTAFIIRPGRSPIPGEYKMTLRVDKAGYNSQTEYVYVNVTGPQFVAVDDYLTLQRGNRQAYSIIVDVLANDYIPDENGQASGASFMDRYIQVVDPDGLNIRIIRTMEKTGNYAIVNVDMPADFGQVDGGLHTVVLRVGASGFTAQYERLYVDIQGQDFVAVDDYAQMVRGVISSVPLSVTANDYIPEGISSNVTIYSAVARIVGDFGGLFAEHKVVDQNGRQGIRLVMLQDVPAGQYAYKYKVTLPTFNPQYSTLVVDVVDPLTANDDRFNGPANSDVSLPVLNNDTTYDGGPLTIIGFTQPGGGATVASSGGALSIYGPAGTYGFGYTVQDQHGKQASATVTVNLVDDPCVTDPNGVACACSKDPSSLACICGNNPLLCLL
ncbi:MAG: Ig-like domain-containing protein [Nitrospinota bacterium]|nr:Ig-like domain-containing protein [Nitrospinota bacterium]